MNIFDKLILSFMPVAVVVLVILMLTFYLKVIMKESYQITIKDVLFSLGVGFSVVYFSLLTLIIWKM